jgi:NtrC-family two-component system response regulator AlgB
LRFFAAQTGRKLEGFSEDAFARLTSYHWPGNLRELRNSIERAVILCSGDQIRTEDLPADEAMPQMGQSEGGGTPLSQNGICVGADVSLERLEEEHLRRVLSRSKSMLETARILGIDQATLYRKRKKLGLE